MMKEKHTSSLFTLRNRRFHQSGFTLIETIVVLVMVGIMAAVAGMGLIQITQGYIFSRLNAATAQKGQIAMARITKELGTITSVTAATANSITYLSNDGNTRTGQSCTIDFSGANLRFSCSTCSPVVSNVTIINCLCY